MIALSLCKHEMYMKINGLEVCFGAFFHFAWYIHEMSMKINKLKEKKTMQSQ